MKNIRAWNEDFSYGYYIKLLEALNDNFDIYPISKVEKILNEPISYPVCFLRHDIDVNIEKALSMATLEHEMKIAATYYFRTNNKFYVLDNNNINVLYKIQNLGHEIGLHYDRTKNKSVLTICSTLESLIHNSVRTISFHRPMQDQLQMGLRYYGLINAYAPILLQWYMSDSSYQWRDGEPLPQLKKQPKANILQLLTHPIWWGEKQMPFGERELT